MGRDGTFITGTDLLIEGGVIAAIAAGRYQLTTWTGPPRCAIEQVAAASVSNGTARPVSRTSVDCWLGLDE